MQGFDAVLTDQVRTGISSPSARPMASRARVAILIPCFNEAASISKVARDFAGAVPGAKVYVYDNNSTDDTVTHAKAAGAIVRKQNLQGKGHVVRRMFADVEADVYVMVDGDATYDAAAAPAMIQRLLDERLDMVVGTRIDVEHTAYKSGHRFGNRLLTGLTSYIFGRSFSDMLSGYRVLSRRFVKSYPAHAHGFEVETELTVHALEQHMPVAEYPTTYIHRMEGSVSKLHTWADGWRILATIVKLTKNCKPLLFFGACTLLCVTCAMVLALPLLTTYLRTGLVPRFPTAILCTGLSVLASVFLICGLVLETVAAGRCEQKRLAYLTYAAPGATDTDD